MLTTYKLSNKIAKNKQSFKNQVQDLLHIAQVSRLHCNLKPQSIISILPRNHK